MRPAGPRRAAWLLPLAVAALVGVLVPAQPAAAHPLDEYLLSSYLTLGPSQVGLQMDLSPGVLAVPTVLPELDQDGDQQVSDTEGRAYAERLLSEVQLSVDGRALRFAVDDVDMPPYLTLQAGYGTLRVSATARGAPDAAGSHEVAFRNGFMPSRAIYQANAYLDRTGAVTLGAQRRDATQQQTRITYQLKPSAARATAATDMGSRDTVGDAAEPAGSRLAGYLQDSLSIGVVLLALGAAALLGALHALTPGHAKTLMAAYLISSGGTARNAITLGAVVTFTHTASVIVVGVIALAASQLLVPGVLVPTLEVSAGLIVLVLGLRLLRQRWISRPSNAKPSPDRVLVEHHPMREHGGRTHSHALPQGGINARNLIAMGVSGGLVPCPEALGVMVLAVGVNRTVLGLAMIASFSLGLAAVLISLGVLLVRSRGLVTRAGRLDPRWTSALPLVSAVVVALLGLVLVLKGAGLDDSLPL